MKKICFLINSMRGGGAERVVSILLENLSRTDRKFFLIVLEDKFNYKIPNDVKIIKIFSNLQSNFKKFFGIFLGAIKLKQIVRENQIDIVVSFLERANYTNILAKSVSGKHKTIICERTNPLKAYSKKNFKSILNKFLIKKLYKKANLTITNSKGTKSILIKKFFAPKEKIKVIYNPVDIKEIREKLKEEVDVDLGDLPKIITIGRLTKAKGHKFLIKAFAKVYQEIPSKLIIIGKGELKNKLKNLSKKLGVENNVLFLDWQENPFKFLARCDIFVLSSLWEGFPNVLVESIACGIPVISTNCQFGPDEIIKDGKNGILVPVSGEKTFAEAILKLLNSPSLKKKFSDEGKKRAKDFSVDKSVKEYEKLFQELLNKND